MEVADFAQKINYARALEGELIRTIRRLDGVEGARLIGAGEVGQALAAVARDGGHLSGTDVTEVNLNLAASGGSGDAQPDTVTVDGTSGDDVILVVGDAAGGRSPVAGFTTPRWSAAASASSSFGP